MPTPILCVYCGFRPAGVGSGYQGKNQRCAALASPSGPERQPWAHNLPVRRQRIALSKSNQGSRVGNGSALLAGADNRGLWPRRLRELINGHLDDLGGLDRASAAERSLIRRASVLEVELERYESKFAINGEALGKDLDIYQRATGNLRRLLQTIGIKRVSKDITLDPLTYTGEAAE
jgi:hypothetical protein